MMHSTKWHQHILIKKIWIKTLQSDKWDTSQECGTMLLTTNNFDTYNCSSDITYNTLPIMRVQIIHTFCNLNVDTRELSFWHLSTPYYLLWGGGGVWRERG
jgi:hypothetical protein